MHVILSGHNFSVLVNSPESALMKLVPSQEPILISSEPWSLLHGFIVSNSCWIWLIPAANPATIYSVGLNYSSSSFIVAKLSHVHVSVPMETIKQIYLPFFRSSGLKHQACCSNTADVHALHFLEDWVLEFTVYFASASLTQHLRKVMNNQQWSNLITWEADFTHCCWHYAELRKGFRS